MFQGGYIINVIGVYAFEYIFLFDVENQNQV